MKRLKCYYCYLKFIRLKILMCLRKYCLIIYIQEQENCGSEIEVNESKICIKNKPSLNRNTHKIKCYIKLDKNATTRGLQEPNILFLLQTWLSVSLFSVLYKTNMTALKKEHSEHSEHIEKIEYFHNELGFQMVKAATKLIFTNSTLFLLQF